MVGYPEYIFFDSKEVLHYTVVEKHNVAFLEMQATDTLKVL